MFIKNRVPILAIDKNNAGVIGDVLIDATENSELGMLSIRRWEQDRYGKPETIGTAAQGIC
ncbi:MAG: hypothetical protein EXR59_05570 [Dehalococcoidia bacterium]|nr:hypothetical protein [Dehalococcoidia bacterium]